jgi:hypothetical protein
MRFELRPAYGAHPVAATHLSSEELQPQSQDCALNLFFRLPPEVFVDPYELVNYRESYTFEHWGTRNLELPVAAVSSEGSAVLLGVNVGGGSNGKDAVKEERTIDLPLHTRYGLPDEKSYRTVSIPASKGFWSCPGEGRGA